MTIHVDRVCVLVLMGRVNLRWVLVWVWAVVVGSLRVPKGGGGMKRFWRVVEVLSLGTGW